MKKLLSILLTLALCIGLIPLTAVPVHAAAASTLYIYEMSIPTNADYGTSADKFSYNAATNTLTLNNFTSDGKWSRPDVAGFDTETSIYANGDLTINLVGNNVIDMTKRGTYTELFSGIAVDGGDLTITGDGKLTILLRDATGSYLEQNAGIAVYRKSGVGGGLTIEDATVDITCGSIVTKTWSSEYEEWSASGGESSYGIHAVGPVTIDNADVSATGGEADDNSYGLYTGNNCSIKDSTIYAAASWTDDYTIYGLAAAGNMNIEASTVEVYTAETDYGAMGLYAGGHLQVEEDSAVSVAMMDSRGITAIYVSNGMTVDASEVTVETGQSNDGKATGIYIYNNDSTYGFEAINKSKVHVQMDPAVRDSDEYAGNTTALYIDYGDVFVSDSEVSLEISNTVTAKPYDAYGIYTNYPTYYISKAGGDFRFENDASLTIEIGDAVRDSYGIYVPSNQFSAEETEISITVGNAKDTTYSSITGMDLRKMQFKDSTISVSVGEAKDGSCGIYTFGEQNSVFDNCDVEINIGETEQYHSTGFESGSNGAITLTGGTEMKIDVGPAPSIYGIRSWGGMTMEDSSLTVTTADATDNDNYGVYAPSDNRGVPLTIKNSTVNIEAGKAGAQSDWSISLGWGSYNGFYIDEDSTVKAVAGGNAKTQSIGIAVYDGSTIKIDGDVTAIAGETAGENARGSFGFVTNIDPSSNSLTVAGSLLAQGYSKAVTGGWINGSFSNLTVRANNILLGEAYDGSDAEFVEKTGSEAVATVVDGQRYLKTADAYTVTVNLGDHMAFDSDSIPVTQSVLQGSAIEELCVVAETDYYFPDDYASLGTTNGITVKLNNGDIIISGTPTADVTIDLEDAEEVPVIPKAATPVLPEAAAFSDSKTIEITCETEDVEIYYTTGSAFTLYTGAFTITETTTVKAYAAKDGFEDSDTAEATYTKKDPAPAPSGGGGGGGLTTYPVKPSSTENGNITASPRDAAKGMTVTVTVTPDEGFVLDQLIVKDKDGNEIEVTEKDGEYTFTMPAAAVEISATFKPEGGSDNSFPFVDVPEDMYCRKAVEWALENGVTGGTSPTTFSPKAPSTRAQMITYLWAASGAPEPAGTENPFKDVAENAYYYKAVMWAYENGITAGISADEFGPDLTVTRAQAVTFLYGTAGRPEAGSEPFTDVNEGDYFELPTAWAYNEGITTGTSADKFSPDADCLREQIITFMYLYFGAE